MSPKLFHFLVRKRDMFPLYIVDFLDGIIREVECSGIVAVYQFVLQRIVQHQIEK